MLHSFYAFELDCFSFPEEICKMICSNKLKRWVLSDYSLEKALMIYGSELEGSLCSGNSNLHLLPGSRTVSP